jgi:hypothetical protein
MMEQKETLRLKREQNEKELFENVIEIMRENFIATFEKEQENSLIMRSVGGTAFRLKLEKL